MVGQPFSGVLSGTERNRKTSQENTLILLLGCNIYDYTFLSDTLITIIPIHSKYIISLENFMVYEKIIVGHSVNGPLHHNQKQDQCCHLSYGCQDVCRPGTVNELCDQPVDTSPENSSCLTV